MSCMKVEKQVDVQDEQAIIDVMESINPKATYKTTKIYRPPNWHECVKSPCAFSPRSSNKECAKLARVEITTTKKLPLQFH